MERRRPTAIARVLLLLLPLAAACQTAPLEIPHVSTEPTIDGDLGEWRDGAYSGGWWDIERLSQTSWYDPERNRLTIHDDEKPGEIDLQARYYAAWDETYLYLGAEARDNVNDVDDPAHEDKRWYFKDCVCWFIEAPRDGRGEAFETGDNALCFLIDESRPAYGAWWRHGEPGRDYVEEPLPPGTFDYAITMDPWGRSAGDFVLEVRVRMDPIFGRSDPAWTGASEGRRLGLEIVHTDPDGGDYGGHFLVYGAGDSDDTWGEAVLVGPMPPTAARGAGSGATEAGTAP